ncbi:MAG: GAF domain-containing protein [Proteobacteria bacterium]|nr:GAF domain-containing protein [Pseudomonadota bacterium]
MRKQNNLPANTVELGRQGETERSQADEALFRERNQLKKLLYICQMADTQIQEISSFVIEECIRISESELGFFGLISEDETLMTAHLWSEKVMETCAMDNKPVEFPCGNAGIWAEAIRQRKPVTINDYNKPDPRKKGCPDGHVALSRLMSIPIVDGGKVVAVAAVANKRAEYTESDYLHIHIFLENMWSIIQRNRSIEALRVSEERFRTVADFTYNWETWSGDDGRYIYVSSSCKRMTGYCVEEFMNDPDLMTKIAHHDDWALLARHEQECITREVCHLDFRIITRDGEERWISHICQSVFNPDGKSLGRRASNQDITQQKTLEIKLDTYNQQLEQLVATRTAELEELNTALKVLLQHREAEKTETEQRILANMNELVTPYLEKLKASQLGITQKTLIDILESNLKDIFSPFLRHLSTAQYNLTPQEIQIATMIQSGRTSKEMASILNVSYRTINFHRENIRKKLGLGNKKVNLRSHLLLIT